jgi:O-antigen/teichoic acid export membrane protein
MIDIFKSLYNYIDMTTVVKGLVNYAYFSSSDAEVIYSMLSTWCAKFNMIVLAISTGIVVSLIPNLTESIVKKDRVNINKKICQALSILLFFTVPMSVGISFLSSPIWNLFYGTSTYGPSVLSYYIFVGLFGGLFTILVTILQTMKDYKSVFISLISGVIIKLLLNYKLIIAFRKMSMPPYYGVITATIIGYLVSFIICIVVLKAKFNINYEEVIKHFFEILFGTVIMIIILFIISLVIPLNISSRIGSLFIILFYSVVGAIIYFLYLGKTGVIKSIFGNNVINSFRKIVFKK